MDARQLEIVSSLFRTAWPDLGAGPEQLGRVQRWMETHEVLLTERVALTEACLGQSDPDTHLPDLQSRLDALELLASLDAEDDLLEELASCLAIPADELELVRLRALKEPTA